MDWLFKEILNSSMYDDTINNLNRTANIIALQLNKKNDVTPDVEAESKHTPRNNQYIIAARNLIYHIIYNATYNKHPNVNKIVKPGPINNDNELFTDEMIDVLNRYMNHLINLVFLEFSETIRAMFKDFDEPSTSNDDNNKRKLKEMTIDDDDDDDEEDGYITVLKSLDVEYDTEEKFDKNLRIVKKLHLTTLMELPLVSVLQFVLDKIRSKHFAVRMIIEVLSAISKKLSKEEKPKHERVFYNFLRQDELKRSLYKHAAEEMYKVACDAEYNRFKYSTSLNEAHDKTPLNLSFYRTMARFTEKVYAFSSNVALELNLTNFNYENNFYDVVTCVRNGDIEIFDVRIVNGQYLECMSWQERLDKLPNAHITNNYKKINLDVLKQPRWLNKLEKDDSGDFVYIRTASLGLGTLFVKTGIRNKK